MLAVAKGETLHTSKMGHKEITQVDLYNLL